LWLPVTWMPLLQPCWPRVAGAEVDHVQPGRGQATHQRGHQARAGEAPVAPHRHRTLAGGDGFAAEGAAELLGEVLVDGLADHAADVIGLEDARVDLHGLSSMRIGAL